MERYIQMSDEQFVFTRTLEPSTPCIGHIHILHGMAEHSGRYLTFAKTLNAKRLCCDDARSPWAW